MQTYWNYSVAVNGRVVVSSGDESLSKALARAVSDCIYYQATNPGAKVAAVDVHESCARCHNGGTVLVPRKRRPAKAVRCPACKGKGAAGRLDDIPFLMPGPANRITLVAG